MNKMVVAAFFVAFGFAVNAQEVSGAKQDPVKKTETKPAQFKSKKVASKKIKQAAPLKKQAEPAKKD